MFGYLKIGEVVHQDSKYHDHVILNHLLLSLEVINASVLGFFILREPFRTYLHMYVI